MENEHCYSEEHLESFAGVVGSVFIEVSRHNCNVYQLLDSFLKSSVFVDIVQNEESVYLTKRPKQLLKYVDFDSITEFETQDIDEEIAWWVGDLLTRFQWRYRIDFKDWLKYCSTKDVYQMYNKLYSVKYEEATAILLQIYCTNKEEKVCTI